MIDHLFLYPDYNPDYISTLANTNLDDRERYWLIPRSLFHKKGITQYEEMFDIEPAESVDSMHNFIDNMQA